MAAPTHRKTLHFKHADTYLLVTVGVSYVVLAVVLHLLVPGVAVTVLLGVNIVFLSGLILELRRRNDAGRAGALAQVQEVVALYQTLQPRRPFPLFTGWAASPELLSTLVQLIADHKPRHVLELGSGASTVVSAYAMKRNGDGHVTSLDHNAEYAHRTRLEIEAHGVGDTAHVVPAPLVSHSIGEESWMWYDLREVAEAWKIDLLIVDGPPRATQPLARYPALPLLYERLSADARVVVDDAWREDEQEMVRRWLKQYPEFSVEYRESGKGIAVLSRNGGGEAAND